MCATHYRRLYITYYMVFILKNAIDLFLQTKIKNLFYLLINFGDKE